MHELKSEIAISDQFYNENLQEVQRINAEMMAQNESGHPDSIRMGALQRSFEHFRSQYNIHRQERDNAWEKYNSSHASFLGVVKAQVQRMAPAQARLLAALKNEIGVPTEIARLLDQIEARQQRIEAAVEQILPVFSESNAQR
ncbi:hypothetical protein Xclt_11725 [Xanthomonas axonopodis pv. clitoriae]|uniref:Uncharacterized protein n=3 Tax=Xanthomonas axonopodis TaxID=53413 RepID=A0ABX3MEL5_9XANT|nr:hypothetical protein Xclt_11725 [Xanthomonas axonopodis pv. clitoriae]OOX20250.1 hypothetical protein Xcaj_03920 [Xanthomonas axonopodis pv. cajani]